MIRGIQCRILKHQGKNTLNLGGWESGVTAGRIQSALASWQADSLPGGYYRLTKPSEDLQIILDAFGIDANLRLPTAMEFRKMKRCFDEAAFI
jgi:hypothetical protein